MPDLGTDDAPWLEALIAAQGGQNPRGTTPIGPPQGIPGQFSGILDRIGPGQGQGAPAGVSGAGQGAPPPGLLQRLNPFTEYNYQRYLANKARGEGTAAQAPPSAPMPAPPAMGAPAAMPTDPNNPDPRTSAMQMVTPPQQPLAPPAPPVPPPQATPAQPQQMPAIPPASPQARVAAAQGQQQGSPLDNYLKQMMALQRQQMMFRMAGGLLGAPSLGMGLGRAFTGAAESMAPQGDMVTKIAAAQAAGQLAGQQPHATKEDVQAAQIQSFFGKPFEPPRFEKYEHGTFGISPDGRHYDTTTGYSTWVHGKQAKIMGPDGKLQNGPIEQAVTQQGPNDHTLILLSDGKWHDAYSRTEEGSVVGE